VTRYPGYVNRVWLASLVLLLAATVWLGTGGSSAADTRAPEIHLIRPELSPITVAHTANVTCQAPITLPDNCTVSLTVAPGSAVLIFASDVATFQRLPRAVYVGTARATYEGNSSVLNQGAVDCYATDTLTGGSLTVAVNYSGAISSMVVALDLTGTNASPVDQVGAGSHGNSSTASDAVGTTLYGDVGFLGVVAKQGTSVGGFQIVADGPDAVAQGGQPVYITGANGGGKGHYTPTALNQSIPAPNYVSVRANLTSGGGPVSYAWEAIAVSVELPNVQQVTSLDQLGNTSHTIAVNWTQSVTPGIVNETVRYVVVTAGDCGTNWTYLSTGGPALRDTISGLERNTTYCVAVAAWNATLESPFNFGNFTTRLFDPPVGPGLGINPLPFVGAGALGAIITWGLMGGGSRKDRKRKRVHRGRRR
jgi:hypothetical protein